MKKENYNLIDEENSLFKKFVKDPMVPLGLVGLTSVVAYSLYNINRRKGQYLSLYLLQTRVLAQGCVLGSLTLGIAYSLFKKMSNKYFNEESEIRTLDSSIVDQSGIGSK